MAKKQASTKIAEAPESQTKTIILKSGEKLKTLTKTDSSKPERKKISNKTYSSRVILISPYGQINTYLESKIPEIINGGYVDVVDFAEQEKSPYIDVEKREKNLQEPYWIIDFQKIMVNAPSIKHLNRELTKRFAGLINEYANHIFKGRDFCGKEVLLQENISKSDFSKLTAGVEHDLETILEKKLIKQINLAKEKVRKEHLVTGTCEFCGYYIWRRDRVFHYFVPKKSFLKDLEKKHVFDSEGNFMPNSISIDNYISDIENDLEKMIKTRFLNLELFEKK